MTWYAASRSWILEQKADHPELSREELRKHCSRNYPFGERRYFPYKAFCKAMREEFGSKRKPTKSTPQGEMPL